MRMRTPGRRETQLLVGLNSTIMADRTRRWTTRRRRRFTSELKPQPRKEGSRLQRTPFIVLDSLRCTTPRSDGEQLTACDNQHAMPAASCESNYVVKHRLPCEVRKVRLTANHLYGRRQRQSSACAERTTNSTHCRLRNCNLPAVPLVVSLCS